MRRFGQQAAALFASSLLLALPGCTSSQQPKMQRMAMRFNEWQEMSEKWAMSPDDTPKQRKQHLKAAFKAIKPVLKFLSEQDSFPEALDPLTLAGNVIGLRQTTGHITMTLPLIHAALDKMIQDGEPLRLACGRDRAFVRRSCQDIYSLLCNSLAMLPDAGASTGFDAAACVAEYNAPRPPAAQFRDPAHAHRQLPGLTPRAWWERGAVPYEAVHRVRAQFATIQEEVLRVATAPGFAGWGLRNDPTLTLNADWDPRASWDAIEIYLLNKWNEQTCALFPVTCGVLREEEAELLRLWDTTRYADLVPGEVRGTQGYDEVPTLGAKLYRVWPGAGIKRHSGSPARLINSLTLQGPPNSTLTVGDDTRPWSTGEMLHFDDAFFHSVDNPDPDEYRIVLTLVTWHPDLNPLSVDNGATGRSRQDSEQEL